MALLELLRRRERPSAGKRSSLNLGDEHQLLEGASKLLNKKYLLSTHCGCSMFTDLLKSYSNGGDLIDTLI